MFLPQARIKAINTFFGINTFCNVDSSVYSQQAQFGSPVYVQQVYSPQQSFPLYPVVSPSWNPSVNPSVMSYFDTPVVRIWMHCRVFCLVCEFYI